MLDATVLEHRLVRGEMLRAVRAFERQRRWNGLLFLNDRGKCTHLVSHQPWNEASGRRAERARWQRGGHKAMKTESFFHNLLPLSWARPNHEQPLVAIQEGAA